MALFSHHTLPVWCDDQRTDQFQARLFSATTASELWTWTWEGRACRELDFAPPGFLLVAWQRTWVPPWGVWGLLVALYRLDSFLISLTTKHVPFHVVRLMTGVLQMIEPQMI
jgi:hypothetical protein